MNRFLNISAVTPTPGNTSLMLLTPNSPLRYHRSRTLTGANRVLFLLQVYVRTCSNHLPPITFQISKLPVFGRREGVPCGKRPPHPLLPESPHRPTQGHTTALRMRLGGVYPVLRGLPGRLRIDASASHRRHHARHLPGRGVLLRIRAISSQARALPTQTRPGSPGTLVASRRPRGKTR